MYRRCADVVSTQMGEYIDTPIPGICLKGFLVH
jgi:hypothetical protein